MRKYYNDPHYDAAFDRWLNTVSHLMMKYGPRVLIKQKYEQSLGLNKGDVKVHSPEDPAVRERRLSGYFKRMKNLFASGIKSRKRSK